MADVVNKLLEAAPVWVHLIDGLLVLCGLSSLLASVLPKSDKWWRKLLDLLAANFGNARNLHAAAHGKPAQSVEAIAESVEEKPTKKTVKDALDKKQTKSVLDERL